VAVTGGGSRRLALFSLTTHDADALAAFFETALGFFRVGEARLESPRLERLTGVAGGARSVMLGVGAERIELLQFDRPGLAYPSGASSSDLMFQHFAIVVSDMARAHGRLESVGGWTAISTGGPERLPAASGGVTAFKFRDPEGHPVELLAFARGTAPAPWNVEGGANPSLGIDHSAISVSDSERSIEFYRALGFRVSARTVNRGPEQARLDGMPAPLLEVTALSPPDAPPHIELLCYLSAAQEQPAVVHNDDVAATRLVLGMGGQSGDGAAIARRLMFDPDGHRLVAMGRRRNGS
jgi:catechol 2,3-dioxygenase-like lactoylglutathione lyase family enzyme